TTAGSPSGWWRWPSATRKAASSRHSRAATTPKRWRAAWWSTCARSTAEQPRGVGAPVAHLEAFLARSRPGGERHVAARDAERIGEEPREGFVRAILERRLPDAHLERVAMHSRHFRAPRAGLRRDAKDPRAVGGAREPGGHGTATGRRASCRASAAAGR